MSGRFEQANGFCVVACFGNGERRGQRVNFHQDTAPQKVRFAVGSRHGISEEIAGLGCSQALVLSTPEQSEVAMDIAGSLGGKVAGVYFRAAMHTPVEVTEDALSHATLVKADCLVAVGGGSTIGLAKAMTLRAELPQIAVPTTYAGSEATPILGQTENGIKTTLKDFAVTPKVVLYDAELVTTLPPALSVASGLNAMAHAVEALYARERTAETTRLAADGLRAFREGLPRVLADPNDLEAREETLRGAWACGTVLGRVGMALHHKLCHALGGSFDLPHAQTHAVVLPHATHYNAAVAAELLRPVTDIFGGGAPGEGLWQFAKEMGAPMALKDLGLAESDLDEAADIATTNPYWNPREIVRDDIRQLLQNAWSGCAPGTH